MMVLAGVGAMGLLAAARAVGADGPRVEAHVVSVSGRSVYLDAGREAGIEAGATVVVFYANGARVELRVAEVTGKSARAELGEGTEAPEVNARCEVLVTPKPEAAPTSPPPESAPQRVVPEHPPWKGSVQPADPNAPLLAPAFATKPEDRPTNVRGRVYTSLRLTHDAGGDRDNDYTYGRLGAWVEVSNPFKDAGKIVFQGDLDFRGADVTDRDESTWKFRIDRLSYTRGDQSYAPYRLELGRFTSHALPEIGLVDGVEAQVRTQGGWNFGGGVGLYPLPLPDRDTGDDYGFHLFAEYESDAERGLTGVVGYQQTWHDGDPDRNLLIGRVNYRASKQWWFYGMTLVDLYMANDSVKDGAGLTQLMLQARYTPTVRSGVSVTYNRTTWPELLRKDYGSLPESLLRDGRVDRVSANGWFDATKVLRVNGSAYWWQDQSNDGVGGDAGVEWRDPWAAGSSLGVSAFINDAAFNNLYGLRVQGTQLIGNWRVFASYEAARYTFDSLVQANESFTRHTVRGDVGWSSGNWSIDVDASKTFGDREDTFGVGLFVERRF